MRTINIETMARHYLIAAEWADKPEATEPRYTKDAKKTALKICVSFADKIAPLWGELLECSHYGTHPDAGSIEAAIGHDLWLTSQGHGCGFWDRQELPEKLQTELTNISQWPSVYSAVYLNAYRGWLYLENWQDGKK